jgi:hypothetical protein
LTSMAATPIFPSHVSKLKHSRATQTSIKCNRR